jgi:hypothetical protein
MNCKYVENWLLQVESLQVKDWPRNMNRHLKKCAACAKVARELYKLEDAWRTQPVPAECGQAKAVFLEQLSKIEVSEQPAKTEKPAKPEKRAKSAKLKFKRPSWTPMRWAAVAAVLFIGVIIVGLLMPGRTIASQSNVVERLVDWNIELTNASLNERQRLLAKAEPFLMQELEKARPSLSPEDRAMAESLLEHGRWLATHDDPIAEAERAADIADKMLWIADAAEKQGKKTESEQCAMRYGKFMDLGVSAVYAKIKLDQFKVPEDPKSAKKVDFDRAMYDKAVADKDAFDKMMADKAAFDKALYAQALQMYNKALADKIIYDQWLLQLQLRQKIQYDMLMARSPQARHPDLHMQYHGYYMRNPQLMQPHGFKK